MSVVDKFLNFVKLNDEDEDYDDSGYYDDDDDEEVVEVQPRKSVSRNSFEEEEKSNSTPHITPLRSTRRTTTGGRNMEVFSIRPTSLEDNGEVITETLLANRTVVLNLEGLDNKVAQRIIDYASGSCYALHGKIQKISQYVFILTPANVDLMGDVQDIETADSFGVQPLKDLY